MPDRKHKGFDTWSAQEIESGSPSNVTPRLCEEYSASLKSTGIAVDSHNRKIKRLRKIFECRKEYYEGDNPFRAKSRKRNPREEIGMPVHRQAFTKEQERQIILRNAQ